MKLPCSEVAPVGAIANLTSLLHSKNFTLSGTSLFVEILHINSIKPEIMAKLTEGFGNRFSLNAMGKPTYIIKLKEGQSAEGAKEKIEKRLTDKQTLFEGYAPEQSAMLKNYCLKEKAGFIFYAVLDEKEAALSAFNKILK